MNDFEFKPDLRDKYENYDNYDKCDKCDKYEKHEKKQKKDAVIACGHTCDDYINVLDCHHKCQVASLEINLRGFERPLVKLDFSSIVKFRDLDEGVLGPISAANASFTLKLFRLSEYNKKICIGTWDFRRYYNDIAIAEVGLFLASTSDSFGFTKCDHPVCEDCAVYIVEVEDNTREENIITKLILTQINFNAIAAEDK